MKKRLDEEIIYEGGQCSCGNRKYTITDKPTTKQHISTVGRGGPDMPVSVECTVCGRTREGTLGRD